VRDLSAELAKPIDLETQGAETELDRQVLEVIRDPLTHMVRNAADHGIEMPRQRIPRASRSGAAFVFPIGTRVATSSLRFPTTAAALIFLALLPRPFRSGLLRKMRSAN
jgi:hypothetical protein